MIRYRVKNWSNFQHYKKRTPPWIKLHRGLLDDKKWWRLPLASRALAPCIWLLASENDGEIVADVEEIAWRLRTTAEEVENGLKPLISQGWLAPCVQDDSVVLAQRKQHATEETEAEAEERQGADAPEMAKTFWTTTKQALADAGVKNGRAGQIVGQIAKAYGMSREHMPADKCAEVIQLIEKAATMAEPEIWLMACISKAADVWRNQVEPWVQSGGKAEVTDELAADILGDIGADLLAMPTDMGRARFQSTYRARASA